MKVSQKADFFTMLTDVMSYYKQDTSEFMLNVFWDACKDVDYEIVCKALNEHAKDPDKGQFAPKVADIVRRLQGGKTDRSAMAWNKVYDAMSRIGAYSDVCFDEAAINAAVDDCGGWPKMCRSNFDELSYLQHRFSKSYEAYINRGDFEYPAMLTGDRSGRDAYALRGLPPPTPTFIGNRDIALLVFENKKADNPVYRLIRQT